MAQLKFIENSGIIAAALFATDPELALGLDHWNRWKNFIRDKGMRVRVYRQYEAGDHDSNITDQMRKMLRIDESAAFGLGEFNDNYMQLIIEKMASRVRISSISTDDEGGNEWLQAMLSRNRLKAIQARSTRAAIRDGDSFIVVDPISLQWSVEPAFDGETGMVAISNTLTNKIIWACKVWVQANDTGTEQAIAMVFQRERISYWIGNAGADIVYPHMVISPPGEQAVQLEKGTLVNTQTWPGEDIPIVHLSNNLDVKTGFGESELRPVIPLQNVLNRLIHSMTMASEFAAFNVRYAIGVKIDSAKIVPGAALSFTLKDEDGNPITSLTDKQIEYLKSIKVGEFSGTDISQYTSQLEALVKEISQTSQTPIYGITATGNLSGEALRQLEIGLIGKVRRFQHENDDAIKQLIALTAQIQRNFRRIGVDLVLPSPPSTDNIVVEWQSPEILDTKEEIRSLVDMRQKAPGLWSDAFYREKIGALLMMSRSEIEKYEGEGKPEPAVPGEAPIAEEEGGPEDEREDDNE